MINTIIIDDEQHCIDSLMRILAKHPDKRLNILSVCKNVETGLQAIKDFNPDLVFLDVHLGDETGFDLLSKLENINFEIIFTTAFDRYAVQAFKFCALDYLLKPLEENDVMQAVGKIETKVNSLNSALKLEMLFRNLNIPDNHRKRICIPDLNGFVFIELDDIIRCQSQSNYTTIFLKEKQKLVAAKTLKEFEELLTDKNFFRIHNSHLINLSHIHKYQRGKGGTVTMSDGTELEVSIRRKEEFLKLALKN